RAMSSSRRTRYHRAPPLTRPSRSRALLDAGAVHNVIRSIDAALAAFFAGSAIRFAVAGSSGARVRLPIDAAVDHPPPRSPHPLARVDLRRVALRHATPDVLVVVWRPHRASVRRHDDVLVDDVGCSIDDVRARVLDRLRVGRSIRAELDVLEAASVFLDTATETAGTAFAPCAGIIGRHVAIG